MARKPNLRTDVVAVDVNMTQEEKDKAGAALANVGSFEILTDAEQEKEVVEDLIGEYNAALAATDNQVELWNKYRKMRSGKVTKEEKNTPYPNASNMMVPYSLILVQNTAGFIQMTFNRHPLWTIGAIQPSEEDIRVAKTLTKYFDIIASSKRDMNAYKKLKTISTDVSTLGASFVKIPFRKQQWVFKKSPTEQINATLRLGPDIVPIQREDFIFPFGYDDIQNMPWCAHVLHLTRYEMMMRKQSGAYDSDVVDEIIDQPRTDFTTSDAMALVARGRSDNHTEVYDVGEFYRYMDVDGDGIPEDVILHIHIDTKKVLKKQVNSLGIRPFVPYGYIFEPFQVEGRGVCETVDPVQTAINQVHNMRYDNMKFANLRMIAVKRVGQMGVKESVYPGKVWRVTDPKNDVVPIQFGEIYPSSVNEEHELVNYGNQAAMMPEIRSGFADQTLKSRDTFSGSSMRLQQAQGLFQAVTDSFSDSIALTGEIALYQMCAHRNEIIAMEQKLQRLTTEEIQDLDKVLSIPIEEIPLRLTFTIKTTEIDKTYDAQVQSLTMMAQMYTNWAKEIVPFTMMLFGPQGAQMQAQAPDAYAANLAIYVGSTRFMQEILRFFGKPDSDEYLPNIKKQEALLKIMDIMNGQAADQLDKARAAAEAQLKMQAAGVQPIAPQQLAGQQIVPGQIRPFETIAGPAGSAGNIPMQSQPMQSQQGGSNGQTANQ